jgi:uroporphyrinogen decarboxylase
MFSHLRQPDFGQLATTLRGGRAERIPLLELGIHPVIKQAILGRPVAHVGDDIQFMRSMGYDFVKIQPRFALKLDRHRAAPSPQGVYTNAPDRAWASEGQGLIRGWEDFERYPWPRAEEISYQAFEDARPLLPDGMMVIGQYGDVFTSTWELMGFEEFSLACVEEPDLVEAMMNRLGDLIVGMYEVMAQMEWVGALWYSDDIAYTSSMMVSPAWLRRHFFPILGRIGAIARRAGKPLLYHSDGLLYPVLEDIIGAGVSALHPIEPLSLDIEELKRHVGNRLCLCGNIDVDLLARATPGEVVALTRRRLQHFAPLGGYTLGSSNSVPDYAKVENYIAMVRTGLEFSADA